MPELSTPVLRLRLVLGANRAIGPGKADLLEAIERTGSISAAGRSMRMSYKRAWQLVDDLNGYFREPAVVTSKGGDHGGGARLTPTGTQVLRLYRSIESRSHQTLKKELVELKKILAP